MKPLSKPYAISIAIGSSLSCTETDTGMDTDMGREMDTTNFEKCGIRYGKETAADLHIYIYIYQKGHETYIL